MTPPLPPTLMVPPLQVLAPDSVSAPLPVNVPPVRFRLAILLPEEFSERVSPCTFSVPIFAVLLIVAVPEEKLTVPVPAVAVIVPPKRSMVTAPRLVAPAVGVRLRSSLPAVEVIDWLILILLAAESVRLVLPPVILLMEALTVMFPAWLPVMPVSTLTLVPASAVLMTLLQIVESSAPGLKVGVCPSRVPVEDWMVTLCGSRSQVPALPLSAEASAA